MCSALLKRDTQLFSCEIYKILKNTNFKNHLQTAASVRISFIQCVIQTFILFTGSLKNYDTKTMNSNGLKKLVKISFNTIHMGH